MPIITFKENTSEPEGNPQPSPLPVFHPAIFLRFCERDGLVPNDFKRTPQGDWIHWSGVEIPRIEVLRDIATRSGEVKRYIEEVSLSLSDAEISIRRNAFRETLRPSNVMAPGSFIRKFPLSSTWEARTRATQERARTYWKERWEP